MASLAFDPYRMTDCKCGLSVRYAMLFYVLKRLGLLGDAINADSRQQHIVLLIRTMSRPRSNGRSFSVINSRPVDGTRRR
jgi:hypothetical protein